MPDEKTCNELIKTQYLYDPYDENQCLKYLLYKNRIIYYNCVNSYQKRYQQYQQCKKNKTTQINSFWNWFISVPI